MSPRDQTPARHRVVIVGGGFGGVKAADGLRRAEVDVTLVDRANHHLFQPLLYQVATGVLSSGQIAPALRGMFRRQRNVRVLLADVLGFDLDRHIVRAQAEHELELPYDTLIVAAGAAHSYFGHDDWARIAPGIKSLDDAIHVRSRILGAFEMAEQAVDEAERNAWMTFVVVGAGPTGVELAGQLAILSRRVLEHDYRRIDPARARIVQIDADDAVLPAFAPQLRERAKHDLRELGVEVQLGAMAVGVDEHGIDVREGDAQRRIEARTVLWAAGVQASSLAHDLAAASNAETDRSGRIHVSPQLSVPGRPEVFAIGDMIAMEGVPGVAPAAIQEGAYVAKLIKRRLRGRSKGKFRYIDKGTVATIGRTRAVAQVWFVKLWGVPAFLIWGAVHLTYLVGWGNRYEAVTRWMWTLAARNRRERLITVSSVLRDHPPDR
ncbi:MAG TPA: NAD(P)/FAD-dependent oxidoreductase [Solirubrobacteraceae bacterium]|nr:NAD(P)/FAD-dependent oxidoreductase [Solirubrobacteraceae bacterium]